jgi:2-polyprenyl-3-methyl-5-hydroxy-6-metoxy-1,4-benzoquinol methylase
MSWDDFNKYYDWEFSIMCTRQKHDAVLWKKLAEEFGGPILELGCGSGRITIPLAEQGYEVNALDISVFLPTSTHFTAAKGLLEIHP